MAQATVDQGKVGELTSNIRGQVLRPGDAGYDEARKVWNGAIDVHPDLIVRCTGVADVVQAVNFARENGIAVSVRGGGHGVAGKAVEGDMVIDLSPMKGIRVDAQARTAQAQAGLTWGEFNRETQVYGLATTGGTVSTTGIAGLTLGGGIGWLMGKHGLACDNVLSFDVVTADGRALTASATENADLYWGLRGAGANLGVVTSFQYQLHPQGQVLGGMLVHPFTRARDVLRFFREFAAGAPDELSCVCGLLTDPAGNLAAGILLCYSGALERGEQLIRPAREFGPPVMDAVVPMSYEQINMVLDPQAQPGLQNYWKADFLKGLSDSAIDAIVEHFARVPSPMTIVIVEHLHGAVRRVGPNDTAFGQRDGEFNFGIFSTWADPADADKNIQWTRELSSAMDPFKAGGVYVNYLGEEGDDRVKAAYGANYQRLAALKAKYDPTNFFRLNQNIRPTNGARSTP